MDKDTLRVWIMPTQMGARTSGHFQRAIAPFEKKHPKLRIEPRVIPWSIAWSELLSAFKRGVPPDILQVGTSWMGTLGHLGYLSAVPPQLQDQPLIAPWLNQLASPNGVRLGVPWVLECSGLIAREDVLEAHGVDSSHLSNWEGFLNLCHRIAATSVKSEVNPKRPLPVGITCRPEPVTLHNTVPWLWGGGWDLAERLQDSQILSHPSSRVGLEYLVDLLEANRTHEDPGTIQPYRLAQDFYQEGRFAFLIGHPWMVIRKIVTSTPLPDSRWPITFLPIPAGPAGPKTRGGGSMLSVSDSSAHKDEAWELVKFLTSDTFMDTWTLISGDPPAHLGAFWSRHWNNPELLRFRQAIEHAQTYPTHPMWTSMEQILARGLSDILWSRLSGKTYEQHGEMVARTADREIASILQLAWDLEDK